MRRLAIFTLAAVVLAILSCGSAGVVKTTPGECTGTIIPGVCILSNGCMFVYASKDKQIKSVVLTGDFIKWAKKGKPMTYDTNTGNWFVVQKLDPGVYQYLFIINGTNWICDPMAIANVPDGTYGNVSVIEVNEP